MFKDKKILVTGSAGFIGYYLMRRLLAECENCVLVGYDNLNDYYDVGLKEWRLGELGKIRIREGRFGR